MNSPGSGRWLLVSSIALFAAIGLGMLVPYSNFVVGGSLIADDFLPVVAVLLIVALIVGVNPLLGLVNRKWRFGSADLGRLLGLMLLVAVPLSSGFLRQVPYGVAQAVLRVAQDRRSAEQFDATSLNPALFPGEMAYSADAPAARYFVLELPSDQEIPWRAWAKPAMSWAFYGCAWWLMLLGMVWIFQPQWRRNERLAMPLLQVQESIASAGESSLFRSRGFWIACGGVFLIHLLGGIHKLDPSICPQVPIEWNIKDYFTREPYNYLPDYIKQGHLYFVFVGIAVLMTTRISFSIWFFALAYAVYTMLGSSLAPPFEPQVISDQRTGAILVYAVVVLWLSRGRFKLMGQSLFARNANKEKADARFAAVLTLVGMVAYTLWLMWAGAQLQWAILLLVLTLLYALVTARLLAETGLILLGIDPNHFFDLVRLFPVAGFSPGSALLAGMIGSVVGLGSRVSLSGMALHSVSLDGGESGNRFRFTTIAMILLLVAMFAGGVGHLVAGYHHGSTLNGLEQPINSSGFQSMNPAWSLLDQQQRGTWSRPGYNQAAQIGIGGAMCGILYYLSLLTPAFPLHPIGLLFVYTWYMDVLWPSILIGWAMKVLIVRYGGARLYQGARIFALGLILGELLAAAFWAAVPVVQAMRGRDYITVQILPGTEAATWRVDMQ